MNESTASDEMTTSPRILVMGAGAIGSLYGARLAGKYETWFVARGEHLKAMQQNGIRVNSIDGDMHEHPTCIGDPSELDEMFDLIIFSVKSQDTPKAIEQIRPIVADHTLILSLQNGIENVLQLNEAFSPEQVVPGTCNVGVKVVEPGVVEHSAFGLVTIGTTPENMNPIAVNQCRDWLYSVGIDIKVSDNMIETIWKKFIWNSVFNMTTGLLNITTDKLFVDGDETIPPICRMLFGELQQAAKLRDGVDIEDDYLQAIVDRTKSMGAFQTSTYQDRQKGKTLEYDAFTGAVVRIGRKHGAHFPYYEMLHEMYRTLEES